MRVYMTILPVVPELSLRDNMPGKRKRAKNVGGNAKAQPDPEVLPTRESPATSESSKVHPTRESPAPSESSSSPSPEREGGDKTSAKQGRKVKEHANLKDAQEEMFVFAWRRKRSSYGTAAFLSFVQRILDVCVTFQTCHVCATFLICMPIKNVADSRTRSSCYVSRSISYVSRRCRGIPFVSLRMLIRRAYASLLRQYVTAVLICYSRMERFGPKESVMSGEKNETLLHR